MWRISGRLNRDSFCSRHSQNPWDFVWGVRRTKGCPWFLDTVNQCLVSRATRCHPHHTISSVTIWTLGCPSTLIKPSIMGSPFRPRLVLYYPFPPFLSTLNISLYRSNETPKTISDVSEPLKNFRDYSWFILLRFFYYFKRSLKLSLS